MPIQKRTIIVPITGAVTKTVFVVDKVPCRVFAIGLAGVETIDIFDDADPDTNDWRAAQNAAGNAIPQLIPSGAIDTVLDVVGRYAVDKSITAGVAGLTLVQKR